VDYSLFIKVMTVEIFEKVEIPPAAAPAEFLPPIFAASCSVSVFPCFFRPLLEEVSGCHIYMGF
jgi:hypothetical protein